ncbi:hypothetical protein V8C86DRAFT_2755828 [Haematococcus lacustris]
MLAGTNATNAMNNASLLARSGGRPLPGAVSELWLCHSRIGQLIPSHHIECSRLTRVRAGATPLATPSAKDTDGSAEVEDTVLVPVIAEGQRFADGAPKVHWVPAPRAELEMQQEIEEAVEEQAALADYLAKEPIANMDLHRLDAFHPPAPVQAKHQVPGYSTVIDPFELHLVGRGLPIIQGAAWPEAFQQPLKELAAGRKVAVPRPHPKFSMQDMERIATQGPVFSDIMLRHVERDSPESASAYNYVPSTVLGDWTYEVEPNWVNLPQMPLPTFWAGLRARNWTARQHWQRDAAPWRVQMFQCGYKSVSGWEGLRALVTQGHTRCWVDMPDRGVTPVLGTQVLDSPCTLGYEAVLAQLYQAHSQRLSRGARQQLLEQGYVTPGVYPYSCPGEHQIQLSWHWGQDHVQHPLQQFLVQPSLVGLQSWVQRAWEESGVFELKVLRDNIWFQIGPEPLQLNWHFDPNSAGPLYFVICLTLGIVLPALRRNRILDISTLEEDPGAAMEFARSKSTARKEGLTGVSFSDVAGLGPLLSEVLEVVEFLKDPKAFNRLGARPPKGILLEGDPGTGKTLLAKALAGEAMVPFYQMAGTEFTEGIVGVGAARVRDLFKRARANAPCIIFVDELDALGLKRAEGDGTGKVNEEREQTLNQLLTEMDGFTPDIGVVFMGATNRADLLDPALMRPGRFDRKVRMPKPDTEGRFDILQLHLRKKKIAPDVDLMQLSRDLPGLVGADLANIVNEAQLTAVRAGRTEITARDMYAGVDRFTQGELRPPIPTTNKLPITVFAAKEAGIALVADLLYKKHKRIEELERVSIQPKGRSYSRTLFARGSDEDYQLMTRGRLLDRIRVALAGHIAVRVVIGQETNFSVPDLQRASDMAHKYVFYYAMSDLGITTWAKAPYSSDFSVGLKRPRKVVSTDAMDGYADWPTRNEDFRFDPLDPSDPTWHRYSDEVRKLIKTCYDEVWAMLELHRDALWAGVEALAERKELLGGEMREVFAKHPPRMPEADEKLPSLDSMVIFTNSAKGTDKWPFGIEWLKDAYPTPYWVQQQREKEREAADKQTVVSRL